MQKVPDLYSGWRGGFSEPVVHMSPRGRHLHAPLQAFTIWTQRRIAGAVGSAPFNGLSTLTTFSSGQNLVGCD